MKKQFLILSAILMSLSLLTGCKKRMDLQDASLPSVYPETTAAASDIPTEETAAEETIEDGNGPIFGQQTER